MKKIKIMSVVMVIVLLICSAVSCKVKPEDETAGYPVTVGETKITRQPKTVVALSAQAASAIFSLGYKSYLVGAPTEFFKTEMEGITDIGRAGFTDFEKIYELEPDVIIAEGEIKKEYLENLKARNISVVVLETPDEYSEIAPYYEELSKLFLGSEKYLEAYEPYISESERIIKETAESLKDVTKKVALFVEEGFVATGDTIAGGALEKAGFINIAAEYTDYMMSLQDIKAADPEIIFCPADYADVIMKNKNYKDIAAVKNGSVYEVDIEALVFASEGFAATLQSMAKYLLQ